MKNAIQLNIVGAKNSGKTHVAESLIRDLTANGLKVGSVKHTSHDHDFDLEGTDSWRHHHAGTVATFISSPQKLICHTRELSDLKQQALMEAAFSDCDFIIWEGDQATENPIIECLWSGISPRNDGDARVIAFITDNPLDNGVKCFKFDEATKLCEFVMTRFAQNNKNWT